MNWKNMWREKKNFAMFHVAVGKQCKMYTVKEFQFRAIRAVLFSSFRCRDLGLENEVKIHVLLLAFFQRGSSTSALDGWRCRKKWRRKIIFYFFLWHLHDSRVVFSNELSEMSWNERNRQIEASLLFPPWML